jgi:Response regulator of the LytR/AlgR family
MNVLLLIDEQEFNLLKPITDTFKGIRWFHFTNAINDNNIEFDDILKSINQKKNYKNKFVVNIGNSISTVEAENIPFFYKNELIFLLDKEGRKYITSYISLDQIEKELNPNMFYRANRTHIINLRFIDKYINENDGKISLFLKTSQVNHIRISKGKACSFRKWYTSLF